MLEDEHAFTSTSPMCADFLKLFSSAPCAAANPGMGGCFSKFALAAVQVCPQSRASLHAAFSKFAQRFVQTCAAAFPILRSADSKLALGVGHRGLRGEVLRVFI